MYYSVLVTFSTNLKTVDLKKALLDRVSSLPGYQGMNVLEIPKKGEAPCIKP